MSKWSAARVATAVFAFVITATALTGCGAGSVGLQDTDNQAAPMLQARVTAQALCTPTPVVVLTPTMSAEVQRQATWCGGRHGGTQIERGRIVSASYSGGVWTVETVGLWEIYPRLIATTVPPPDVPREPYPTREPWRDLYYVVSCTSKIGAVSGFAQDESGRIVAATPPGQPRWSHES